MTFRVAWFSAWQDEKSLSAYVSNRVVPLLAPTMEIHRFGQQSSTNVQSYLSAFAEHAERPFDIVLYHLDASAASRFMRMSSPLIPGLLWVHQACFPDLGPEPILNSSWSDTIARFVGQQGEWPRRKKNYRRRGPYADREIGMSFYPIFSHERDLSMFLGSDTASLADELGRRQYSRALPIPAYPCSHPVTSNASHRLAFFGSPSLEFRPHKVLEAISAVLSKPFEGVWFCPVEEHPFALQYLERFHITSITLESLDPTIWHEQAHTFSLCLHTVFSNYSNGSPFLEISLANGMPVVALDYGSTEGFPEGVLFPVIPGEREAAQITQYLQAWISGELPIRNPLAKQFAEDMFAPPVVAAELHGLMTDLAPKLRPLYRRWSALLSEARHEVLREVQNWSEAGAGEPVSVWQQICKPFCEEMQWR